jgi:hypothetical protein
MIRKEVLKQESLSRQTLTFSIASKLTVLVLVSNYDNVTTCAKKQHKNDINLTYSLSN